MRAIPSLPQSNWPVFLCSMLLWLNTGSAEPVRVRYTEGILHGFLELQTLDGKTIERMAKSHRSSARAAYIVACYFGSKMAQSMTIRPFSPSVGRFAY